MVLPASRIVDRRSCQLSPYNVEINGEVDVCPITGIYAAAGELDHAFEWFDNALADRMLLTRFIRYAPELDQVASGSEVRSASAQAWSGEAGGRIVRPLNRKNLLACSLTRARDFKLAYGEKRNWFPVSPLCHLSPAADTQES
jgi:hypothetical protein